MQISNNKNITRREFGIKALKNLAVFMGAGSILKGDTFNTVTKLKPQIKNLVDPYAADRKKYPYIKNFKVIDESFEFDKKLGLEPSKEAYEEIKQIINDGLAAYDSLSKSSLAKFLLRTPQNKAQHFISTLHTYIKEKVSFASSEKDGFRKGTYTSVHQ